MIPADHTSIIFDGTEAWVVTHECDGDHRLPSRCHKTYRDLDQPCGECGGDSERWFRLGGSPCPDCIDGRLAFTINVSDGNTGWTTYRVSVIPGMVLPIKKAIDGSVPETEPCVWLYDGTARLRHPVIQHETNWQPITLPPAAAPGMWAVLLKVAQ